MTNADQIQIEALQDANQQMRQAYAEQCVRQGHALWDATRELGLIAEGFREANPDFTPSAQQLLALGRCYARALLADTPTYQTPVQWAASKCRGNQLLDLIEVVSGPMTLAVESDGYTHS